MFRSILFLLALTLLAPGQNPPDIPRTGPAPAAAGGADGELGNRMTREDQTLFPKLTGEELAELYREFTGRRVTVSVAAAQQEFRFVQRGRMTYAEAAQLLRKAALIEGFVFVPDVNMANHEVLVVASGNNPKDQGLPVIIDSADLPEEDVVVSYVMNLKFIKPEEVVRTFTQIVGQLGPYGSIAPVPNASAVVITEKTSLIRTLIDLQETIDVPSQQVATRFIRVQYADVQELSDLLNEILNTQQQSQTTSAGLQRVQGRQAAGGVPTSGGGAPGTAATAGAAAGGGESGGAGEDIPIQIVPDTRTNRIFAMGRPIDIVFVEGLVREFDTESDSRNYLRRKLRFLSVVEFLPVAEQALLRAFSGTGGTSGAGGSTRVGGATAGRTTGRTNQTNRTNQFGGGNQFGGNSQFGGTSGSRANVGNSLEAPEINSAPEAVLVGRTLLVADNITNSLVVQGPPASLEIINNLLDQIDVKSEQVMISAVFGQLSLGEDLEFGVDFARTLSGDGVGDGEDSAGRGGGGLFPLVPLDGSAFDPGALAGAGLSIYGNIGNNFNVIVNALQSDSRFKVMSRPTIFTGNNQKGVISAGQRIAVPTNSFNSGATGQSTNIEYQDVLLSLEVVPLVNSENDVTLQIALLNDEVIGSQNITGVGEVPTIGRREVLTTVTVPDGSTIVLGGLISSTVRESVSGIPLLSDIPGLGKLFSSTTTEDDRQELMIFIQPRIVDDPASLYDSQVDMDNRYSVSSEARDFSAGPDVLPQRGAVDGTVVGSKGYSGDYPAAIPVDEREVERDLIKGRPGSPFRR